jgi:hypothetical protein
MIGPVTSIIIRGDPIWPIRADIAISCACPAA